MTWFVLIVGVLMNIAWLVVAAPPPRGRSGVTGCVLALLFAAGQTWWLVDRVWFEGAGPAWVDASSLVWHAAIAPVLILLAMISGMWRLVRRGPGASDQRLTGT